jgi:hypothetical protein
MRRSVRVAMMLWTAGLALGSTAGRSQEAPPPTAPAPDTVGPKSLQNFTLQGNVTRPADPPAEQPAGAAPAPRSTPVRTPRSPERPTAEVKASEIPARAGPKKTVIEPSSPVAAATTAPLVASPPPTAPTFAPASESPVEPEHHLLLWPWLLALATLGLAAAFLFWRSRSHRPAFAGGPQLDLFAAPEPVPSPAAPRPAPPSAPLGIVSTNLRPWLKVDVRPQRCIVTEETVTIEFELDLLNSGNAPARAVHLAAALINAGDAQEQELASFFAQGAGPGERIDSIQQLKQLSFPTQIAVPISQVRVLEMAGRRVFVPLLAINAHYEWGGKAGQSALSYMVGRQGQGEKLAPFRLDLGARIFRGLGARLLPGGLRT